MASTTWFRGMHPDFTGELRGSSDDLDVIDHTYYANFATNAHTWKVVSQPLDKNIIRSKWVFYIKQNTDGSLEKYKAQLIARGFTQIYRVDYLNTYSPIAQFSSIHSILAMAVHNDWEIESFAFNGAYLNDTLNKDKEIYMCPLLGYEINYRDIVLKLLKSIYGLNQAGCRWYEVLCHMLLDIEFNLSNYNPGIIYARVGDEVLILTVHMDNCILTRSSTELIKNCKALLNSHYPPTDLGPIHWVLGIKIT